VVAGDWNYLINPQHLDFVQISIEPPIPFKFDERLFESKWYLTKNHSEQVVPSKVSADRISHMRFRDLGHPTAYPRQLRR